MHCADSFFPGLSADGGFAELVRTNERALVPLEPGLEPGDIAPFADAGLAAIHAVKKAAGLLPPGTSALAIGAGGLGHIGIQCLRALTPARVIAIDRSEAALALAGEIGADEALVADGRHVEAVRELTGGGADAVLDFVGEDDTIADGLAALRPGGAYYAVGYGGTISVPTIDLVASEVSVVGSLTGTYTDLVELMALAAEGKVRLRAAAYPLEAVNDAIGDLESGRLQGRAVLVPRQGPPPG
jgi:NAD+-dependent secondary alcohol dehydrogenase Adh1